ncbi:MAG: outer membrane protein assembly factor BamE [Pseudomonadota bacterium]
MSQNKIGGFATLASTFFLSACASNAPVASNAPAAQTGTSDTKVIAPTGLNKLWTYISPYKITVQQGNFISQEMVSQLKVGMTREQVRFLLGTALLTDMFHEDRWDYPFRLLKPSGELITSQLSITFKNNTVAHFEGGNLPSEKEYLAHITESAILIKAESMPVSETPAKK